MKIYLAGPMRSFVGFNFPAFHKGAVLLRQQGHVVFNPAEADLEVGFDPAGLIGRDEELAEAGFDLRRQLGADLAWISSTADAVVVLPGWQQSSGVRAEVATALALCLPIWEFGVFVLYGAEGSRVTREQAFG